MKQAMIHHVINVNQELIPLHQFTPLHLCDHIKTWVRDDINYKRDLSQTKLLFTRRQLNGRSIISQPMDNITDIIQIVLSSFMTHETLKIILSHCQKLKQENTNDVASKSAEQIADILFNYPLNKLLKRITSECIDGNRFIQYIHQQNEDIIAQETGWNEDEVYQIHSVLFRYHTFTELQFKQNMNVILNKKYGDVLSPNAIKDIQHFMAQHDVEDIHCKIKNAFAIDEFSDAVINMVDEHIQNKNNKLDEHEFIVQIYKAIAECFIYREAPDVKYVDEENNDLTQKLQHWICNNCGNCNVNAYINNQFTTTIKVCTLCGMYQRDQIILKLRNHDSYIMVNDINMKDSEIDIDNKESEDESIDIMIRKAIKADGAFNLFCPHENGHDSCISVLRLAKRLIQYKRWLHTIYRNKGSDHDDANKTVKVDIAKYINNNVYKQIYVDVVCKMELMTKKEMQSVIEFIQMHSYPLLDANLFMEKNVKNETAFSEILQSHIKLSESCVSKLYNLALKAIKKIPEIDPEALKRILIETVQFIQQQTSLLIKLFEGNVGNIADIKLFTNIKPLAFAKIVRDNIKMDLATGSRLYRALKPALKQRAQTLQFGQFLCDLDLEIILKDYHHILQMHIEHGNKESIKNVFRFFQKIVHYDDNDNEQMECRSVRRKTQRFHALKNKPPLKEKDHNAVNETKDIWELKQIYVQTELDIIHCHLVHCDVQRALKRYAHDNNNMHDEQYVEEYNDSAQNEKFVTELSESDTTNYGFGINHEHPYLKHAHDSIHDELLLNKLSHQFTVQQWQNALVKAIKKRNVSHDIKCKYYQKQYNIIRNECIGLRHLCALCIYADSSEFCTMFRKTYRQLKHEMTNNVIQKHQQLYYYAKSLYESIEFFGESMSPNLKVYHGLDRILFFSKFTAFFNQPISTSLDINIANSFSKGSGIILTLRAATNLVETHKTPKYLSISWLSSFPHEVEYLFYGENVVFNICNIHNVEFESKNKKRTILKEHSKELLLLNEFQKIISDAHVTYTWNKDSDSQKILLLVELIHKHRNDTSHSTTTCTGEIPAPYISEFGNELFSYFCQNQKEIWIYNFVKLPTLLRNALLIHPDHHHQSQKYEAHISFIRIAKLFVNVQEIVLNGLDIKQMTADADIYFQSVLKYVQKSKETQTINLRAVIFKSQPQSDKKPNATLQNLASTYLSAFIVNDWELYYALSVDKTHNIVFRMRSLLFDNVPKDRNKRRSTVFPSVKWTHLPSYFMQVTSVDEDSFLLVVSADTKSNKSRKLYLRDKNQSKYLRIIKIKKDEISRDVDIAINKHKTYRFALYKSEDSMERIPNSTKLSVTVLTDETQMPPNNKQYTPKCIELRTVFQVEDKKQKQMHIYWNVPPNSFGNISYRIERNNNPPQILSKLPYSIPFATISPQDTFRVITIAQIEESETVLESNISEPITIEYGAIKNVFGSNGELPLSLSFSSTEDANEEKVFQENDNEHNPKLVLNYDNKIPQIMINACNTNKKEKKKRYNKRVQWNNSETSNSGKKWKCNMCTYLNKASRDSCLVCGDQTITATPHDDDPRMTATPFTMTHNSGTPTVQSTMQNSGEPEASHDSKNWECDACTFSNVASCASCSMCGYTKKLLKDDVKYQTVTATPHIYSNDDTFTMMNNSASASNSGKQWECARCTYSNKASCDFCSSCGIPHKYGDYDDEIPQSQPSQPMIENTPKSKSGNGVKKETSVQEFEEAASFIECLNHAPSQLFGHLREVVKQLLKDDVRYQTLDITNPKVRETLIRFNGVVEFLMLLGFGLQPNGNTLFCKEKPRQRTILNAIKVLTNHQTQ